MARRRRREDRYVRGIFNYCDRLCEHCPATDRCRAYDGIKAYCERGEVWDAAFWQKLQPVFERTMAMLFETADSAAYEGPIVAPWRDSAGDDDDPFDDEAARTHPLSVEAHVYSDDAHHWLEDAAAEWLVKEAESAQAEEAESAAESDAPDVGTALELIQWHRDQIRVKILRALSHPEEEDPESTFPKDSDGSAKVALLAVERSIAAWGILLERFPHREQELLGILKRLYHLRQGIESAFPNARAFVRPWFDDA